MRYTKSTTATVVVLLILRAYVVSLKKPKADFLLINVPYQETLLYEEGYVCGQHEHKH